MAILPVLLLSVGLAMDATAVAAARGLSATTLRVRDAAKVAFLFGAFQAGMPLVGWAASARFAAAIDAWDHWIAFTLLAGMGAKMVRDGLREDDGGPEGEAPAAKDASDPYGWAPLLALALATSIDALVAGFTLPTLAVPVGTAVASIGLVTALLSGAGVYLGRRFGAHLGARLTPLGGVLLIGLGVKVLVDHLP